ncbi:hypothetical protein CROQUDRAFT_650411 [Cronartium quercuum f. sp. fusiforme G11]|uniref:Uncharacterized protein n=1 Tax=Cronartium quercuum f. sp. fusiforme G11 TaxID=708437 RepID=A0A9P6TGV3_9BASI|nr:hypothetical protein CROQUDRAFT_650411 [Cronartium quercuum f. sp. fusiforme G11]
MISGLTKAYEQLDTHLAIKIAIQLMMDKLHLYCDAALDKPHLIFSVPNASSYVGTTIFSFTIKTNQEVKALLKVITGH